MSPSAAAYVPIGLMLAGLAIIAGAVLFAEWRRRRKLPSALDDELESMFAEGAITMAEADLYRRYHANSIDAGFEPLPVDTFIQRARQRLAY